MFTQYYLLLFTLITDLVLVAYPCWRYTQKFPEFRDKQPVFRWITNDTILDEMTKMVWIHFIQCNIIPILFFIVPDFCLVQPFMDSFLLFIVGIFCQVIGVLLVSRAQADIHNSWVFDDGKINNPLLINGIYSRARHPVISGGILQSFGLFCILPCSMTILLLQTKLILSHIQIKLEEIQLQTVYGNAFLSYQFATPKLFWFPANMDHISHLISEFPIYQELNAPVNYKVYFTYLQNLLKECRMAAYQFCLASKDTITYKWMRNLHKKQEKQEENEEKKENKEEKKEEIQSHNM